MSTQKPLYGVGQHVMLRFKRAPQYNCDHTIIMAAEFWPAGKPFLCEQSGDNCVKGKDGWVYIVSKYPNMSIDEVDIQPRPEVGEDWESLQQTLKRRQPEHCA